MSRKNSNRQSRQQQRRRIAFNRGIFNFQKLEKRNLLAGLAGIELDSAPSEGSSLEVEVIVCSGWNNGGWFCGNDQSGGEFGPVSSGDCQSTAPDGGDNFGEGDGSSGPETPGDCLPPAGGLLEDGISEGDDSSIDERVDSGDPSDFGEVINIMGRISADGKDSKTYPVNRDKQNDLLRCWWPLPDMSVREILLPGTVDFVDGSDGDELVGPSDPSDTDDIISIDLISKGDEKIFVYPTADFDRGEEPLVACTDFPATAAEVTSAEPGAELAAAVWMNAANDELASFSLTKSEVTADEVASDALLSNLDQIFAGSVDLQFSLEPSSGDESLDDEVPGVLSGEMDDQGVTDNFRLDALFERVLEEAEA